jgi:exodeoxyribonuclease-5
MNFTDQQQQAISFMAEGTSMFALGGYAGTGKTEVTAAAALELGERAVLMAPTNKAAAVLAIRTGRPARTIHKAALEAVPIVDKDGVPIGVRFVPGDPVLPKDAVCLIDEASMVGGKLWSLVQEAIGDKTPVALIGDPFQLPPINDTSLFHHALDTWPSVTLTEVFRQEEGSKILDYATKLREGAQLDLRGHFDRLTPVDPGFLGAAFIGKAVVLTHTNDMRVTKIRQMRRELWAGHEAILPQPGEPMIGYANDPTSGVYNGFTYRVIDARESDGQWSVNVEGPWGSTTWVAVDPTLAFDPQQKGTWFPAQQGNPLMRSAPLTFAYAMTVHAAQGSQWPYVLVERRRIVDDNTARWVYTAVTRAQEEVFVL